MLPGARALVAPDLSVSTITSFAALLRDACPPFILARADPAGSQTQGPLAGGPHPRLLDASHKRRASHSGQHLVPLGSSWFPHLLGAGFRLIPDRLSLHLFVSSHGEAQESRTASTGEEKHQL